jgi:hypothetical protein
MPSRSGSRGEYPALSSEASRAAGADRLLVVRLRRPGRLLRHTIDDEGAEFCDLLQLRRSARIPRADGAGVRIRHAGGGRQVSRRKRYARLSRNQRRNTKMRCARNSSASSDGSSIDVGRAGPPGRSFPVFFDQTPGVSCNHQIFIRGNDPGGGSASSRGDPGSVGGIRRAV